MSKVSLQQIIAYSKAYGFIYNSSEIYGGLQAVYDYGPYGVLLKRRIQDFWWRSMTGLYDYVVGLDAAILMSPSTWKASGHVDGFNDWLVDHKVSQKRYRVDVLLGDCASMLVKEGKREEAERLLEDMCVLMERGDGAGLKGLLMKYDVVCPVGKTADWTDVREFNLMLSTGLGAVKKEDQKVYLRPETAQGIFVNFMHVQKTARMRIPFGIAQIGKAFRNEIVARQFIFRMREFEQMEMQFFVEPDEADRWFDYWKHMRTCWYGVMGIKDIRVREHDQLAHYAAAAVDIEYGFPFGFKEVEGIHNRTDFDLKSHGEMSKKSLSYFDMKRGEHYTPYVIETSVGCDRLVLMLLSYFLREEEGRSYLALPAMLAPLQVAIFPLMPKVALVEEARRVWSLLRCSFSVTYDDRGSIGKRYALQDLLGTPYCVTVDFQTLEDEQVTVRDRDTMKQVRVPIVSLHDFLMERVDMGVLLRDLCAALKQEKLM